MDAPYGLCAHGGAKEFTRGPTPPACAFCAAESVGAKAHAPLPEALHEALCRAWFAPYAPRFIAQRAQDLKFVTCPDCQRLLASPITEAPKEKSMFQKATKKQSRLRAAFMGPSGAGKTYSALRVAQGLAAAVARTKGSPAKIALIDTERGSAAKYADQFAFDSVDLDTHHPQKYIDAIHAAEKEGYDVLIIDSLTHAWNGRQGALELVDEAAAKSKSKNSFMAWRDVTPLQTELVDTILRARCHVIVTMRSKMEYILEDDGKGKQTPRKVGLAPIQRDGMEYEFDVVGDIDLDAKLIVTKTRCPALSGKMIHKPGPELGELLAQWLDAGVVEPVATAVAPTVQPAPAPKLEVVRTPPAPIPAVPAQNPEQVSTDKLLARLVACKDAIDLGKVMTWARERQAIYGALWSNVIEPAAVAQLEKFKPAAAPPAPPADGPPAAHDEPPAATPHPATTAASPASPVDPATVYEQAGETSFDALMEAFDQAERSGVGADLKAASTALGRENKSGNLTAEDYAQLRTREQVVKTKLRIP